MNKFFENFIELVNTSQFRKSEIADKLNVSRTLFSNWLSKRSYPNYDDLIKISNFFEITIDQLLGADEIISSNNFKTHRKYKAEYTETKTEIKITIEK